MGESGENVGVLNLEDALGLAKSKGVDLIEVAPNATPPVARIMAFDKFRYQKEKEERKQRKAQQVKDLKQIRISPRAAAHDLELKIKQAEEFLSDGHRVEVNLRLIGREKYNKNWGLQKLNDFLKLIKVPYQTAMPPKFIGKGFATQISKK